MFDIAEREPQEVKTGALTVCYARKYPLTFDDDSSSYDIALTRRYQRAWKLAKRAASLLKERFGAKRVVVFGSLSERSRFTSWSDVDLAVWGIPDERFYAAVGAVTALAADLQVDLVDADDCRDSLREVIESEGIEV